MSIENYGAFESDSDMEELVSDWIRRRLNRTAGIGGLARYSSVLWGIERFVQLLLVYFESRI